MTQKEMRMAAELLRTAADEFANHGCNDLDEKIYLGWTDEEKANLSFYYHTSNGDPEEAGTQINEDWIAMIAMAHKLDDLAK